MLSVPRSSAVVLLALCVSFFAGCAPDVAAYRAVSLQGDLNAEALARYQAEMAAIPNAELRLTMTLESTNGWPLGLLAYWRKGVVEAVMTPSGDHVFVVSESRGYGPVSLLHVGRESAVFDAEGRRLVADVSSGVLWGQLVRKHVRWAPTADGQWLMDGSVHLLLNLFHWRVTGAGPAAFWILGEPSPIGWGG